MEIIICTGEIVSLLEKKKKTRIQQKRQGGQHLMRTIHERHLIAMVFKVIFMQTWCGDQAIKSLRI